VSDVRRAVLFAREHGLPLSIKGGGHNVAGHAVSEGGLMLDLGAMRGVRVDAQSRTARADGGVLWADFDREAGAFGLATTAGVISTTGVAGLTLGGGIGWLVGKHGMTIDNLLSVELVTADGKLVTASATEHPDLFWALRGGGGNFGVATSFEFQLHHQDAVLAGVSLFPIDQFDAAFDFYREFSATKPDELTVYFESLVEPETGVPVCGFAFCYSGDLTEGERVIAPLKQFGTPALQEIAPMPFAVWQQAFDASFPHGRRYYWKGSLFRDMTDDVRAAVKDASLRRQHPASVIAVEGYAGAMNRVDPTATAFAQRDARFQIVIVGGWDDPADDEAGGVWVRGLHAAIEPHSLQAPFLNFNVLDGGDRQERVRGAFGSNWDRLIEVKRRYDPANLFHENNNIVP
jgi:FAD/FMN-containing dehydrogenase